MYPLVGRSCGTFIAAGPSGKRAREGLCAADPDILPLGSRIRVHDAGAYSGECEIADTGRTIKGRKIGLTSRAMQMSSQIN